MRFIQSTGTLIYPKTVRIHYILCQIIKKEPQKQVCFWSLIFLRETQLFTKLK
jgi:hypothetical protein